MQARPDFETERTDVVAYPRGAVHGAGRAVESRQETVTRALDLAAAVGADMASRDGIVRGPNLEPARIAHPGGEAGGVDDVGEQHGRELTLGRRRRAGTGQEFLDRVEDLLARGRVKRK